jgi:hypothetical protein
MGDGRNISPQNRSTPYLRLLSTTFTAMVNCGAPRISIGRDNQVTRGANRNQKPEREGTTVRATISFSIEVYKMLEAIAREKKVSLAWVVREAAENYVADKWPLFAKNHAGKQP